MKISLRTIKKLILTVSFCGIILGCSTNMPDDVKIAYDNLPQKIDFNFHVRPILSDRCFHCHGPDEKGRKADLRLDIREKALSKITDKEIFPIVPGNLRKSAVVSRILAHDPDLIMPPPEAKLILTSQEKATLIKWIEQGAEWKDHWAFIPPEKEALPDVKNKSWVRNEIDYFILAQLEKLGLPVSAEADSETLIRRLYLDLIGLPPGLDEVKAFISNKSENAYEELVDHLLASPRYGERWAWEWMDVARYADTNGYQGDPTRIMWPWRDWVIRSFNQNMPYDEFTIKQLAGDLLPNATDDDILATAFNRNHPFNGEGGKIVEETRVQNVFDRVETVGTTWMGLTLNCSRCHDHKFDALTQREYYQLFDYFNQTSETGGGSSGAIEPLLDLSPIEDKQTIERLKQFVENLAAKVDAYELKKFPRDNKDLPPSKSKEAEKVTEGFFGALNNRAEVRNPHQLSLMYAYFQKKDRFYAQILDKLRNTKLKHSKELAKGIRVMVMDEREEPRSTFVLSRGTYSAPQEQVFRNVPKVLPPLPESTKNDRLALANWLVSSKNPLTARVTVNRYWQAFFGNGIVKTAEDFGVQGDLPTHPKLLDWLSVDFQETGWDLKAFFKKIVMSATYRQSSKVTEEALEKDPENKYLGRSKRIRLPAWMLRDQALLVSGLMKDSIGGKPVKPYQPKGVWSEATFGKIEYDQDHDDALYRRTIYTFWRRIVGPTFLFDNSNRQVCSVKPLRTNTPLHALTTLNDVTYMEAAKVFAESVLKNNNSDRERLEYAFQLATSRKPRQQELGVLENRLSQLKAYYSNALEEAKKVCLIGEYELGDKIDFAEHASFTLICSLILNLDETITRQ
ncbi:PSD1 and planctomycete cytochrome C domain-containing protein [Fulvivirgaceae bacterium BMA12]|uniref:PSD1 and planctomycete cytochrome C domain-containing protein n=1 Tax=Agaribacillus aureus TaxID=3051825 RepID=A0ABT8L7S1_9BACT|nr:PSD1 and planctomycete cytochrome C domain-containing protein [Fulvivirgaceae bacterium BMA12]